MVLPEEMAPGVRVKYETGPAVPEGAGLTRRFRELRVCERFGLRPDEWARMSPEQQGELLAFEGIRQWEELQVLKAGRM